MIVFLRPLGVNVRTTSDVLGTGLDAQRTYPVSPVRVWA